MSIRPLFLMVFLLCSATAFSLTMYEIKYEFPTNQSSPSYTAFLVRYGDGTGFMRVRYYNTTSQKDMVVDMSFQEIYSKSNASLYDYDQLEFKGKDPVMIMGETSYNPDFIWFQKKAGDAYFRPWGVTSPNKDNTYQEGKITSVKLLNASDLTSSYVNLFFATSEPFYVSLFSKTNTASNNTTYTNGSAKINLYLVSVANTRDPSIGKSCEVDLRRTQAEFSDLCDFMGFNFVYKEITGSDFGKYGVQRAIAGIYPSKNDVVVFVYSGHGFSYNNDPDHKYPQLDLRRTRGDDINSSTLNIADIYNQIKAKNARLNIVLSDCCNTEAGINRTMGTNFALTQKSSIGWNWSSCASLFLNSKASIIVSAAKKGEAALCNSDIGGYFTYSFFTAMEKKFSKGYFGTISWDSLISDAENSTIELAVRNQCENGSCRQDPIHWVASN